MAKRYELKRGAVVFFEGEKNNKMIFLLRTGSLAATSYSYTKKENETRKIKIGEFFGVKSALTDKPREETIQVLENGQAVVFALPEFNEMLKSNIKILLQLLIAFSNDMLSIHKQIESKMSFGKSLISDREKILENANHYYNSNSQTLALYTFERYKELYPKSAEIPRVIEKIEMIKNSLSSSPSDTENSTSNPS